ncbi:MAG: hypothetical protein JJ863_27525 [Deltaproteobacteria bacterium]|nr:hypothetical protein [Deltaproteobacteria bacterium]
MTQVHVLTWNLDGLTTRRVDRRAEEACVAMVLGQTLREAVEGKPSRPPPQVIALQEVVKRIHLSTLRPHLEAAGFSLFPPDPAREDGDYSMIAARPPWTLLRGRDGALTESPLARRWVEVQLRHDDGSRLRVITAHLESLRSGSGSRAAQAAEIDRMLGDPDAPPTVFLGDTNLRASEWRAIQRDLAMRDAFDLAGRPPRHSPTWWPRDDDGKPTYERGFRFDRIWLDPGHEWTVQRFQTRRHPRISDHAALEAHLALE